MQDLEPLRRPEDAFHSPGLANAIVFYGMDGGEWGPALDLLDQRQERVGWPEDAIKLISK
jgi:hypothetical protein